MCACSEGVYLHQAAPSAARDTGLHPPRQRQQFVVSLPLFNFLCLLSPLFLRVIRVRLVLPLQPASLPRLHQPLRVTPLLIFIVHLPFILLLIVCAGRWRAVSQKRPLFAGHRAAIVAGRRSGLAPVVLLAGLWGALEVRIGSWEGGGGGERALVTVVQNGSGQADLPLLRRVHLGFSHRREHFPLVQALHVCMWNRRPVALNANPKNTTIE